VRVAVVGAGIAGALLAWRLHQADPRIAIDVYTGGSTNGDASGASGGMVRGFEPTVQACRLAASSQLELSGDERLRQAAAYRELGSVYLLPPGADVTASVGVLEELLPGSAGVLGTDELTAGFGFHGLPAGVTAVVERCAGYLSPARLRDAVLGWLADGGASIRPVPVITVRARESALLLADGTTSSHDAVVVAAGPWTPALLRAGGLGRGLRTKQIQYTCYRGRPANLGVFVDETTGLYGRPTGDHGFLIGLPCDRWDVDPDDVRPDAALVDRLAGLAGRRLAWPAGCLDHPMRTVVSSDCYHDPPGLALRELATGAAVFTFTGGSGGAAKTALAASRAAATALLGQVAAG
jgi:glycine/D-amino acid oxidase-like deaminating enzyme